jgi:diadenosine tetraphosphate (Ap4A) HIT family hydrolase
MASTVTVPCDKISVPKKAVSAKRGGVNVDCAETVNGYQTVLCDKISVPKKAVSAKRGGVHVDCAETGNGYQTSTNHLGRVFHPDVSYARARTIIEDTKYSVFSTDIQPRPYVVVTVKEQRHDMWDLKGDDWKHTMDDVQKFIRKYHIEDGTIKFNWGGWNQFNSMHMHIVMDANQYIRVGGIGTKSTFSSTSSGMMSGKLKSVTRISVAPLGITTESKVSRKILKRCSSSTTSRSKCWTVMSFREIKQRKYGD